MKNTNGPGSFHHFLDFCYHGDVVEDAGGLLAAAAGQRAEDNFHQVLGVSPPLLTQPQQHLLQQELHGRVFHRLLLLDVAQFITHQRLRRSGIQRLRTGRIFLPGVADLGPEIITGSHLEDSGCVKGPQEQGKDNKMPLWLVVVHVPQTQLNQPTNRIF